MTKSKCIFVAVQFSLILGIGCAVIGYVGYLYPPYEKASSETVEPQTTLDNLLDAIEWVESRGNTEAVGDNGNAVGSFQIWKIYVDDVNRINKINHKDRYSAPIYYFYYERESLYCSRYMVKTYLEHYATKERIGREPTFEDMARIHNGGPNGWKKESTKPYWEKVKARLEK